MFPEDNEKNKKLNTLNYWLDVESHSPPNIRTSNFSNKGDSKWNQSVLFKRKDEILWNEPLVKEIEDPKNWVHKVFLGIFNTKYVIFEFSTKEKEDLEEMKQFHNTCLVSFLVDGNGRPIKNTLRVPDYLKSIALTTINEQEKAKKFEIKLQDIYATWSHRIANKSEDKSSTINYDDMMNLLVKIMEELNWTELTNAFENKEFHSLAYTESLKIKDNLDASLMKFETDDITSSMIFNDLEKVVKAVELGQVSLPLDKYLKEDYETVRRLDVVKSENKAYVESSLHIDKMPSVCWPFTGGYPLVTSQQYAVNKIFKEIDVNSVLSVNGPPGTGKTTLLKDIVANIIYKRAKEIIKFKANPTSAFQKLGETSLKVNSKNIQEVFKMDESLCGFEIVVASSNNGAVENITKELPRMTEIDEKWQSELSYMSKIATKVNDKESWGMISAILGNKNNNYKFFSNFLYNQKGEHSVFDFLKHPNYFVEKRVTWEEACLNFEEKERKVNAIKSKLKTIYNKVESFEADKKSYMEKRYNHEVASKKFNKEKKLYLRMKKELSEAIDDVRTNEALLMEYKKKANGLFSNKEKALQEINAQKALIIEKRNVAKDLKVKLKKLNAHLSKESKKNKQNVSNLNTKKAELLKTAEEANIGKPVQRIPNKSFWDQPFEQVQKASPWHTKELNDARVELFIASMDLHKAFIAENNHAITSNLEVFKRVLNKDFNESNEYLRAVWQSFFLTVPIVSTTFSSFGSLFNGIKAGTIGWLLIDEAGQATPQAPVGALWRSKRAVFVGDPLQVQPVVQIEDKLSSVLLEKNNTSIKWSSNMLSAQEIADRINPFGTAIHIGEVKWVGMPLRVHRRCDNPMFEISNRIAYNNLMIFGKKNRAKKTDIENQIGAPSWFDVKGEPQGESHWVPDEGSKVITLLSDIMKSPNYEYEDKLPKLYIITPFKNVAFDLKRMLKNKRKEWVPEHISEKDLHKWVERSIGTIHSFQGGETEVVFLVLGGNKARPGAINWVCDEPNILNVATTRAQKAFYIIGNKEIWNSGVFGLIKEFIK